jgi:hypothetical protein
MPTADVVITSRLQPSQGWNGRTLSDIWAYRELLYFIWRDIWCATGRRCSAPGGPSSSRS